MKTLLVLLLAAGLCAACGVADTAVGTAAVAQAKKTELENARATQARIEQQIELNQQLAQDRLKAVEDAAR